VLSTIAHCGKEALPGPLLTGALLSLSLMSPTTLQASEEEYDPWEGFNRKVFAFNDFMDRNLLKPVAQGYEFITPDPVDRAITNTFSNVNDTLVVLNDAAQFKFTQALSDTARFVINTTVGFFGVFDVATHIGLPKHDEDFGQTLGYWGVGSGPYLMLPFLGPSTLRDFGGSLVDYSTGMSYPYFTETTSEDVSLAALQIVDLRSDLLASENLISGDRYLFIRSAYLQNREYLVTDGASQEDFSDDFYDDFFQDDEF